MSPTTSKLPNEKLRAMVYLKPRQVESSLQRKARESFHGEEKEDPPSRSTTNDTKYKSLDQIRNVLKLAKPSKKDVEEYQQRLAKSVVQQQSTDAKRTNDKRSDNTGHKGNDKNSKGHNDKNSKGHNDKNNKAHNDTAKRSNDTTKRSNDTTKRIDDNSKRRNSTTRNNSKTSPTPKSSNQENSPRLTNDSKSARLRKHSRDLLKAKQIAVQLEQERKVKLSYGTPSDLDPKPQTKSRVDRSKLLAFKGFQTEAIRREQDRKRQRDKQRRLQGRPLSGESANAKLKGVAESTFASRFGKPQLSDSDKQKLRDLQRLAVERETLKRTHNFPTESAGKTSKQTVNREIEGLLLDSFTELAPPGSDGVPGTVSTVPLEDLIEVLDDALSPVQVGIINKAPAIVESSGDFKDTIPRENAENGPVVLQSEYVVWVGTLFASRDPCSATLEVNLAKSKCEPVDEYAKWLHTADHERAIPTPSTKPADHQLSAPRTSITPADHQQAPLATNIEPTGPQKIDISKSNERRHNVVSTSNTNIRSRLLPRHNQEAKHGSSTLLHVQRAPEYHAPQTSERGSKGSPKRVSKPESVLRRTDSWKKPKVEPRRESLIQSISLTPDEEADRFKTTIQQQDWGDSGLPPSMEPHRTNVGADGVSDFYRVQLERIISSSAQHATSSISTITAPNENRSDYHDNRGEYHKLRGGHHAPEIGQVFVVDNPALIHSEPETICHARCWMPCETRGGGWYKGHPLAQRWVRGQDKCVDVQVQVSSRGLHVLGYIPAIDNSTSLLVTRDEIVRLQKLDNNSVVREWVASGFVSDCSSLVRWVLAHVWVQVDEDEDELVNYSMAEMGQRKNPLRFTLRDAVDTQLEWEKMHTLRVEDPQVLADQLMVRLSRAPVGQARDSTTAIRQCLLQRRPNQEQPHAWFKRIDVHRDGLVLRDDLAQWLGTMANALCEEDRRRFLASCFVGAASDGVSYVDVLWRLLDIRRLAASVRTQSFSGGLAEFRDAFRGYDVRNNGTVDSNAFVSVMERSGGVRLQVWELWTLFAKFDTHRDGMFHYAPFFDCLRAS